MESKELELAGGTQRYSIEWYSIRRFNRTLKAVAELVKRYNGLQDDMATFRTEYGARHPKTITRELCNDAIAFHRSVVANTDDEEDRARHEQAAASWERTLAGSLADRTSIDVPGTPSGEEVLVHILPMAIENAEEEVAKVLGLVLVSNLEFAEARKASRTKDGPSINETLIERGDEVLDTLGIDDLLELVETGVELLLGDMRARRERAGKIKAVLEQALQGATGTEPIEGTAEEVADEEPTPAKPGQTPTPTSGSTPSSDTSSGSSTGSAEPTAGPSTTPSTGSPSERPSTSQP